MSQSSECGSQILDVPDDIVNRVRKNGVQIIVKYDFSGKLKAKRRSLGICFPCIT